MIQATVPAREYSRPSKNVRIRKYLFNRMDTTGSPCKIPGPVKRNTEDFFP